MKRGICLITLFITHPLSGVLDVAVVDIRGEGLGPEVEGTTEALIGLILVGAIGYTC